MRKRRVLVLKKDNLDFWSAYYQGEITEVAGGWMKIKEHFWSRGKWIPTVSEMIEVIDIRRTNIGLWKRPDFIEKETNVGFKVKDKKQEEN